MNKIENHKISSDQAKILFHFDFQKKIELFDDLYHARQSWVDVTGLSSKTFDRYRKEGKVPTGENIIRAYRFILNIDSEATPNQILTQIPNHALTLYKESIKSSISSDRRSITNSLLNKPIHYKIFIETMNQNYINKDDSIKKWGSEKTAEAFHFLESVNIIEKVDGNFYRRGKVDTNFSSKDFYNLIKHTIVNEIEEDHCLEDAPGDLLSFSCFNYDKKGLDLATQEIYRFFNTLNEIEMHHRGSNVFHFGLFTKTKTREEVIQ